MSPWCVAARITGHRRGRGRGDRNRGVRFLPITKAPRSRPSVCIVVVNIEYAKRPGGEHRDSFVDVVASNLAREWRNRQTRTVQVRVPVRAWGFNSPLAHQYETAAYQVNIIR